MCEKDYLDWHKAKYQLNKRERPHFHEREIWFCYLGLNVGSEQNGAQDYLRPVIIFKKFNEQVCLAIPLTSKQKRGKYYFKFRYKRDVTDYAILSQIRLIDSKRLKYLSGYIHNDVFSKIKKKIRRVIF